MTQSTDPYLYPGTDVLKNLRNIRDHFLLSRFEAEATSRRIIELVNSPLVDKFDLAHLQAIHKYIFQDVYVWAGEFRTLNISKEGHLFASSDFVATVLKDLLQRLAAENYLRTTDWNMFAASAGFFLGEINAVHPFREGNGRAQRQFMRELGVYSGFVIDWSCITRDRVTAASRDNFQTADTSGLAALILTSMR
jgi:cell filamentation protein, protein adenylyltransferase